LNKILWRILRLLLARVLLELLFKGRQISVTNIGYEGKNSYNFGGKYSGGSGDNSPISGSPD
jgi:hypothetical protein